MIAVEEILTYADSVRVDEARYMADNRLSMLEVIDSIETNLKPTSLRRAITMSPDENQINYYYNLYDTKIPTTSADLMTKAWEDLITINQVETYRSMENWPKVVEQISQIINDYILPMNGLAKPRETVADTELTWLSKAVACPEAEHYFEGAYRQVVTGDNRDQAKLSVYHNKDGKLIAFRKSVDVSSALTLEPISLYGSVLPAGSIVGVDRDIERTDQPVLSGSIDIGTTLLQTFEIGDKFLISPVRLSPWAYPRMLDRSLFAIKYNEDTNQRAINMDRLSVIQAVDLDSFRLAASWIMKHCGLVAEALAA